MIEDLRHALRLYRRTPVASLLAVVVLAIGVAGVTAFVSLYVDLVLRPHPGFERGGRIVSLGWSDGRSSGGLTLDLIERIANESLTLDAAAGAAVQQFLLSTGDGESRGALGEMVTREFFGGLKPRLARGRGFLPEEHDVDGEPVIVISHRYWREEFAARDDVIGKVVAIERRSGLFGLPIPGRQDSTVEVEPTDFRIVGVMSPDFTGTRPPQDVTFWIPVERGLPLLANATDADAARAALRFSGTLRAVGLRNAGAGAVARELNARFLSDLSTGTARDGRRFDAIGGLVADAALHRDTQRQLQLFLGGSVLLTLVAAANLSLFLLARAPARRRELGIRLAVGAPLARIARQLMSEASVLVFAGAVLGLVGSVWLVGLLRGLTFLRQAQWRNVTLLDWRVLAIVGALLGLLALLVSLAPILGLRRVGIAASSRQISARAGVAQRIAGTAQIAIAAAVGGAAVAFAWYLGALLYAYPGYSVRDMHAVVYSTPQPPRGGDVTAQLEAAKIQRSRIRDAFAALPGVTSVAIGGSAPGIQATYLQRGMPDLLDPTRSVGVRIVPIDEHYVGVLGLKLLHGRAPETNEPSAVVVNQSLARRFFGRVDVVGESFASAPNSGQRAEIVGVVEDLSFQHPRSEVEPMAFAISVGTVFTQQVALIESKEKTGALRAALQKLVDSGAVEIAIRDVSPLRTSRIALLAADRARGFLTIGIAALVVLLAGLGFYGTQRSLVAAGRREYAIRGSLGAGPSALGRLVIARGLVLGLPGLLLGLPLAFMVVAWLRDYYVSRFVSPALATLMVALGITALLLAASVGPARRARATQPAPLLRED